MTPADQDVRAAILGDRTARNVVGRWLFDELRKRFAKLYRDDDKFEDLLQSVMVVIWANKSGKAPHNAAGLLNWAHGVTVTEGKKTRRLTRRAHHREAVHAYAYVPEPVRPWSPDSMVDMETLAECVEQLSTPLREAVIGRMFDHTPARFAAEQGVKPGTVRKRYSKAVEQIKEALGFSTQPRDDDLEHGPDQTTPSNS